MKIYSKQKFLELVKQKHDNKKWVSELVEQNAHVTLEVLLPEPNPPLKITCSCLEVLVWLNRADLVDIFCKNHAEFVKLHQLSAIETNLSNAQSTNEPTDKRVYVFPKKRPTAQTLLHIAAKLGYLSTTKSLANLIDVNTFDHFDFTPLSLAIQFNHQAIVEFLLDHQDTKLYIQSNPFANPIPLIHQAAVFAKPEISRLILNKQSVMVNYQDGIKDKNNKGFYPVHYAAMSCQPENHPIYFGPDQNQTHGIGQFFSNLARNTLGSTKAYNDIDLPRILKDNQKSIYTIPHIITDLDASNKDDYVEDIIDIVNEFAKTFFDLTLPLPYEPYIDKEVPYQWQKLENIAAVLYAAYQDKDLELAKERLIALEKEIFSGRSITDEVYQRLFDRRKTNPPHTAYVEFTQEHTSKQKYEALFDKRNYPAQNQPSMAVIVRTTPLQRRGLINAAYAQPGNNDLEVVKKGLKIALENKIAILESNRDALHALSKAIYLDISKIMDNLTDNREFHLTNKTAFVETYYNNATAYNKKALDFYRHQTPYLSVLEARRMYARIAEPFGVKVNYLPKGYHQQFIVGAHSAKIDLQAVFALLNQPLSKEMRLFYQAVKALKIEDLTIYSQDVLKNNLIITFLTIANSGVIFNKDSISDLAELALQTALENSWEKEAITAKIANLKRPAKPAAPIARAKVTRPVVQHAEHMPDKAHETQKDNQSAPERSTHSLPSAYTSVFDDTCTKEKERKQRLIKEHANASESPQKSARTDVQEKIISKKQQKAAQKAAEKQRKQQAEQAKAEQKAQNLARINAAKEQRRLEIEAQTRRKQEERAVKEAAKRDQEARTKAAIDATKQKKLAREKESSRIQAEHDAKTPRIKEAREPARKAHETKKQPKKEKQMAWQQKSDSTTDNTALLNPDAKIFSPSPQRAAISALIEKEQKNTLNAMQTEQVDKQYNQQYDDALTELESQQSPKPHDEINIDSIDDLLANLSIDDIPEVDDKAVNLSLKEKPYAPYFASAQYDEPSYSASDNDTQDNLRLQWNKKT